MKPEYANTFGIRKVADKEGNILEVTLDMTYKYMETAVTVTPKGLENISTPAAEQVGGQRGHEPSERHRPAQSADPDSGRRDVKIKRTVAGGNSSFFIGFLLPAAASSAAS